MSEKDGNNSSPIFIQLQMPGNKDIYFKRKILSQGYKTKNTKEKKTGIEEDELETNSFKIRINNQRISNYYEKHCAQKKAKTGGNLEKNYQCVNEQMKRSIQHFSQCQQVLSPSIFSTLQTEKQLHDFSNCVGIIQCYWRKGGRNGEIELVGYATAFAIAPRVIVTCAHAIVETKRQRVCTVAYFIPVNGQSTEADVYETEQDDFAKFQKISSKASYSYRPLPQDFAVLILRRPLNLERYLKLSQFQGKEEEPLQIWGYPSSTYDANTPRVGTDFKRKDLSGKFIRSDGNSQSNFVLVHTMQTKGGHSGSPILRFVNKQVQVVGIHTHRGDAGTNEGLLISKKMNQQILRWAMELQQIYEVSAC